MRLSLIAAICLITQKNNPMPKSYIIKLMQGRNVALTMEIDVPTKKDAQYCANHLKSSVEAIINVNNRLCGWDHHKVNLTIVIEDYKP